MLHFCMFLDFEFLPWKRKDEQRKRDLISTGYIIREGPFFKINNNNNNVAFSPDTPISINLTSGFQPP